MYITKDRLTKLTVKTAAERADGSTSESNAAAISQSGAGRPVMRDCLPEQLSPCIGLSQEEIARLVLCLLLEEALKDQLASFRSFPQHLATEPIQG
jgi:hypothetical protein